MKKHVLGVLFGMLTCVGSLCVTPRTFYESALGSKGDQRCLTRTFSSNYGEEVVLWACSAINPYRSPQEEFEFNVRKYSTISRSDSRAVGSYFNGEVYGYCVLRLDGDMQNDICSASLGTTLEFERQFLAGGN